jgi:hypothetical protein
MYIDPRLRNLLWKHRGYILTHPPKSAGTSLEGSLLHKTGFFRLDEVLVPTIEANAQAQTTFEAILDSLQETVALNQPWIMSIGHQSFANEWHLDLPQTATILINYRPTSERLLSWIRYYSKIIAWTENTSFEVHQDGSIRKVSPDGSFPGVSNEQKWFSGNEFARSQKDINHLLQQIQLKLQAPLVRNRLHTNLPDSLMEMLGQGLFNYRDMFPKTFTKSPAFRHQTIVIPIHQLGSFTENVFGVKIPSLNESKEIDIQIVTGLEEREVRVITERLAKPDQQTEKLLLTRSWEG